LPCVWKMTEIAIIGRKALIGDSREFQDVRGIGVKPVGAEFRLRDMSVNDQGSELVTRARIPRLDPDVPALSRMGLDHEKVSGANSWR
jgi:hypothetical protein